MSVVNAAAANRVFQEFSTENMRALSGAMRVWRSFAMELPSSSRSTLHAWLANTSAFVREWRGSRVLNEMQTLTWEVINRKWELSWSFNEDQIRDDLSGLVAMAIQQARGMAEKWAEHEDNLVATTVQAGKTSVCYDGQDFFSTSHPTDPTGVVSGTYSNLLTAKPLTHANLITALQTMRGYTLPDGSPWVGPQTKIKLLVDATNVETARQITGTQWMSPTASYGSAAASAPSQNILQGVVEPIYNGYFNNQAGVWYLAAESAGIRPIMFQRRQAVESQELGPGSQLYFDRKQYQIGQDARYACSYTHPQLMIRVEPT
jgi:phage major head subunit gpT-like protein